MYHFFAEHENIHDSYIDIVGSDVNHIKNVLRFKEGDKLLISSGDNVDYECSIASMSDTKQGRVGERTAFKNNPVSGTA